MLWLEVSSHLVVKTRGVAWANGKGKMLLGRNRSDLCFGTVATVALFLVLVHWLSSGAGFLWSLLHSLLVFPAQVQDSCYLHWACEQNHSGCTSAGEREV